MIRGIDWDTLLDTYVLLRGAIEERDWKKVERVREIIGGQISEESKPGIVITLEHVDPVQPGEPVQSDDLKRKEKMRGADPPTP